jgi:hypothetical protein
MIIPTQMSAQFVLTISHNEPYAKSLQRQKCAALLIRLSEIESVLGYCESGSVAGGGGMRVALFRLGGVWTGLAPLGS